MVDQRKVLTSWKEIARHLSCGVRTAQRWERELDLPIHRPRGKFRGSVLAVASELDAWVKTRPTSDMRLNLTAPTLQDAMLQALEYLERRVVAQPCRVDVRLVIQLGENDGVVTTVDRDTMTATQKESRT
jgi:hypothetical protein